MLNVIKEYLVSLGMSVDKSSFNEANKTIQTIEKGVKSFASTAIKEFALAGTAIVSALAGASVGIATFLGGLAKADLEMDIFARRMWVSKETAAELNNSLKAMGATIEDLYLSPELLRNFQQMRATIKDMRPPPEFQEQMKFVRSIRFEFQRMRLEMTYGLQWVGFYLFKYLEGPIRKIKGGLQGFNDSIIKSMPQWTRVIAQGISWIGRLGVAFVRSGRDILDIFSKIDDHIPRTIKTIGAALIGLGIIIRMGPLAIIPALFTAILLLLDDFYTYLDGGESAFAPLWKKLQDFYFLLKDTGVIDRFWWEWDRAFSKIETWIKQAQDALGQLYDKLQESGYLDSFEDSWISTFGLLYQIIKGLWEWVTSFFDDLNRDDVLSGLLDSVINLGTEVTKTTGWVADLVSKFLEIKEVQEVLEGIGNFISGTLELALESIKFALDNITNSLKIARSWLSGNDEEYQQALKERQELMDKQDERGDYYGKKIKDGFNFLFLDGNAPNPFLSSTSDSSKQTDKLNNSVNNLPKGMEPSLKKAFNESEVAKGLRTFNQDMNKGFSILAVAINPDVFEQYQAMTTGGLPSSYMYATNSTSNQTVIKNENKPVFYINSTEPKAVAQEVNQQWNGMNIRSMRGAYG